MTSIVHELFHRHSDADSSLTKLSPSSQKAQPSPMSAATDGRRDPPPSGMYRTVSRYSSRPPAESAGYGRGINSGDISAISPGTPCALGASAYLA
jgi:hypothetical protein